MASQWFLFWVDEIGCNEVVTESRCAIQQLDLYVMRRVWMIASWTLHLRGVIDFRGRRDGGGKGS